MHIDVFKMERMQSTWENVVDYNLSESCVHPLNLKELLTPAEIESLTEVELGYTQTNGSIGLRARIARLYPGIGLEQILATAGSVLSPAAMKGIVDLASSVGAWILADEVYQGAELSGVTTPSFWGRWDKTLIVNGLSKAYGLPGLRVGWIIGPEEVVKRTWPYHDYTTISPSALSDRLATLALAPGNRERILARTRGILNANFPVLETWLKDHGGLFSFRPTQAGAIGFARYGFE